MTRAIGYVPSEADDFDQHTDRRIDSWYEQGYQFRGLVRDWATVEQMLGDGQTSVVIVSRPDHIDPKRTSPIGVVGQDTMQVAPSAGLKSNRRSSGLIAHR